VLRLIANQVAHELRSIPWARSPRLKTLREAIRGNPGTKFVSMNLTTSSGYPYISEGITKKGIVEIQGDRVIPKKHYARFKTDLMDSIDCLYAGTAPAWIHLDSLKVEWRSVEKAHKARLVSGSPFVKSVCGRMLFGSFQHFLSETSLENETLIGFNPYEHAGAYVRSLLRFGNVANGACADYKGFDTDHTPLLIELCGDIINTWYGDALEHQNARKTYIRTTAYSHHVRGSIIEKWKGSMPSGDYLTTILNCLINKILVRFAWWNANGRDQASIATFRDYVQFYDLGDDNCFTVHESYKHLFHELAMKEGVSLLGYTITSADKVSEMTAGHKRIEDVEMLKRCPRYDVQLGQWVLPLRLSVILAMPLRTKSDHPVNIAISNLENALSELSLHSEETWNEWAPKMVAFFQGVYSPKSMDRAYYFARVTKTGFFDYLNDELDY